jgi:hypothetical protein
MAIIEERKPKLRSRYFLIFIEKFNLKRMTWTFGAAGHGKGTWDGLGGTCKKNMSRVIIARELTPYTAHEVYLLLQELMDSEAKRADNDRKSRILIKRWEIIYLENKFVRSCVQIKITKDIEDIKAFYGGSTKCFFFEAFHRDGLGYQLRACWCHACVRGKRIESFGGLHGCLAQSPFEYQVCKRTDEAWLAQKLVLTTVLANEIGSRLVVGSVIVYDPLHGNSRKKRISVFEIGVVTNIDRIYNIVSTAVDFEYSVTVRTSKVESPTLYSITTNAFTVNSKQFRYIFRYNPIVNDKISLSNERFTEITCAYFNEKQIF